MDGGEEISGKTKRKVNYFVYICVITLILILLLSSRGELLMLLSALVEFLS